MASVSFEQATRRYPGTDRPAVDRLDLAIGDGEFLVLVGPSGCGKSTSLRMVAGLESVDSGRIRIAGRDVTATDPKDRDIAMVFQNYALYPHMTVAQNMGFALKIAKTPKAQIRPRAFSPRSSPACADHARRVLRQLSRPLFTPHVALLGTDLRTERGEAAAMARHPSNHRGRRGPRLWRRKLCDVAGEHPITTIDTTATATGSRASVSTTPVPVDIVMRPSTEQCVAAAPRGPRRPTDSLTQAAIPRIHRGSLMLGNR
jgi:ABC-type dipeptide/oligopeptide/nickel transport system ATPase component